MKNTALFLGTSHGDPSLTRFCSSTLYSLGGTKILLDAGEPVSALLIRNGIRPADLDAVFLTHMHVDHANGLGGLYCQILKYPERHVEMFFADPAAIAPFMQWNNAMRNNTLDDRYLSISAVSPGMVWQKNGISVSSVATGHMGKTAPSYAYIIRTPQLRILHTGDLAADFHDFPLLQGDMPCDICVCEATHIWNHQEIFLEKLMKAPIRKLILNHIGPFWTDGKEQALRDLVSELPFPTVIAADNMQFDLG